MEVSWLPAVKFTGPPTWLAMEVHGVASDVGPHSKKVTVPVGLPPAELPVTVA